MAKKEKTDAHHKIHHFELNQTGPHALLDSLRQPGAVILRHIIRDGGHHGIVDKN